MKTPTTLALGLMARLEPLPAVAGATALRALLSPSLSGGLPLISALSRRLPEQVRSDLLWAAAGINRPEAGGRTAPSGGDQAYATS